MLLRGQVVLGVLLVAACAGAALAPGSTKVFGGSRSPVVVAGLVGLLGTPALLAVERWLVRRPQPVLSPDQLAADDAIRSQSIQSIAASGMAIVLALQIVPLTAMGNSEVPALRWLSLPGFLAIVPAVFVAFNFGHLRWRVRRTLPASTFEAAPC
jgi:hypothetical protein